MTMSLPSDGRGFRPGAVTAASSLAAVAGIPTCALSVVLFAAIFGDVASSDLRMIITWLAVVTQLAGALLLVQGGRQLANGVGRKRIVIGASMLLLVFPAHLYYVEMELRRDPAEGDVWKYVLPLAVGFAVTIATILILALSRATTEYLRTARHHRHEEPPGS